MAIYITSDLHWGHKDLVKGSSTWSDKTGCRLFGSVQQHDTYLRSQWNATVAPGDLVIVVGDWYHNPKPKDLPGLTRSLNGRKVLIRGNHDGTPDYMRAIGFDKVYEGTTKLIDLLIGAGHTPTYDHLDIVLNHYPWRKPGKYANNKGAAARDEHRPGTVLWHGHTHQYLQVTSKTSINFCTEAWDYAPVPIGTALALTKELRDRLT